MTKKILIIEDEEALRTMLADKLEREGYSVVVAGDGEEGLAVSKKESPDLILLDILMPKMGGIEVLEAMHEDKKLSSIPVIIISNSGQEVEIDRAKALGAKDYLVKAEFDPEEVIEKVGGVLGVGKSKKKTQTTKVLASTTAAKNDARNSHAGGPKVLVVEDDQFLRDLIIKKLEDEGFETFQAIDGEEGLRLAKENKPNLILLDLILPGIDGFEVLKQIKGDADISETPVVILSNLGQKDDIDRGIELGAKDYLIKAHFTPGEIVKKAQEIIGQE